MITHLKLPGQLRNASRRDMNQKYQLSLTVFGLDSIPLDKVKAVDCSLENLFTVHIMCGE
jgi:hypothetical protein